MSRAVGTILALLVLTIIVMATVERNGAEGFPAGKEMREMPDSSQIISARDSLPSVVDGRVSP